MPQLDKYIFFHQIIFLTLFVFLIYFYSRKTILPKLSKILKLRERLLYRTTKHVFDIKKFRNVTRKYSSKTMVKYLINLTSSLNHTMVKFEKNRLWQWKLLTIKVTNFNMSNNFNKVVVKYKKEKNRFNLFF